MLRNVRLSIVSLVALLAAACGTQGASPLPVTSPSGAALPSRASASPSSPPNVREVLLTTLRDPKFAFTASTTAHVVLGKTSIEVTGTYEFAAGDSHSLLVQKGGDATERIIAGVKQYQRTGDGPWFNTSEGPRAGDIGSAIAAIRELRDLGTESKGGRALHHFAPKDGTLTARTLDLDRPDTSAFTGTIDLFADDSGALVSVTLQAKWRQRDRAGTAEVDASNTLELAVSGNEPIIKAPDDAWLRFASTRYGYTIGYPEIFKVIEAAAPGEPDVFGASASEFFVVTMERQPSGSTLAGYTDAYVDATNRDMKVKPDARGSFSITGLPPGELLEYHLKVKGEDAHTIVAIMLNGRDGFTISVLSPPGREQATRAFFQTLLGTFEIAE